MGLRGRDLAKVLLLIVVPWAFIVLAAPLYNRPQPELGGWPFAWWYLTTWVFIQPALTYVVYRLIDRRGGS